MSSPSSSRQGRPRQKRRGGQRAAAMPCNSEKSSEGKLSEVEGGASASALSQAAIGTSSGTGDGARAAADADVFTPQTLVSGGQTGADSIALAVYEPLGIELAGFMPRGFARSDGQGREVARRHPSLKEGEGGHSWRDRANAAQADACVAFLTTLPMTGRGTTQTVRLFTHGKYDFLPIEKPRDADFLILEPRCRGNRPVIVFWDVTSGKVDGFAATLRAWLRHNRPRRLMVSGPVERSWPGVEALGAEVFTKAVVISNPTTDDAATCEEAQSATEGAESTSS